jgi:uncharacterized protein with FMN-binding domain
VYTLRLERKEITMSNRGSIKFAQTAKKIGATALLAGTLASCSVSDQLGLTNLLSAQSAAIPATALPPTVQATNLPAPTVTAAQSGQYKDGDYSGSTVQAARWGTLQVKAIVRNGQLTDVQVLAYPRSTSTSTRISQSALPILRQEAIQAQTASVQIVSGATPTSNAFAQSLQSALSQAVNS